MKYENEQDVRCLPLKKQIIYALKRQSPLIQHSSPSSTPYHSPLNHDNVVECAQIPHSLSDTDYVALSSPPIYPNYKQPSSSTNNNNTTITTNNISTSHLSSSTPTISDQSLSPPIAFPMPVGCQPFFSHSSTDQNGYMCTNNNTNGMCSNITNPLINRSTPVVIDNSNGFVSPPANTCIPPPPLPTITTPPTINKDCQYIKHEEAHRPHHTSMNDLEDDDTSMSGTSSSHHCSDIKAPISFHSPATPLMSEPIPISNIKVFSSHHINNDDDDDIEMGDVSDKDQSTPHNAQEIALPTNDSTVQIQLTNKDTITNSNDSTDNTITNNNNNNNNITPDQETNHHLEASFMKDDGDDEDEDSTTSRSSEISNDMNHINDSVEKVRKVRQRRRSVPDKTKTSNAIRKNRRTKVRRSVSHNNENESENDSDSSEESDVVDSDEESSDDDDDEDGKVYCICKKPHQGLFMISCDNCSEWFHGKCVSVTASEARRIQQYICPSCRRKTGKEVVYKSDPKKKKVVQSRTKLSNSNHITPEKSQQKKRDSSTKKRKAEDDDDDNSPEIAENDSAYSKRRRRYHRTHNVSSFELPDSTDNKQQADTSKELSVQQNELMLHLSTVQYKEDLAKSMCNLSVSPPINSDHQ